MGSAVIDAGQRVWSGWWWPVGSVDSRVPGTLRWDPDSGISLELIGALKGPEYGGAVLGEVDGNRPVSLWGVAEIRSRSRANKRLSQTWDARSACIGAHIGSENDDAFTGCVLQMDNLFYLTGDQRFMPPQWHSIPGVEDPGDKQPDGSVAMPYLLPVLGGSNHSLITGDSATTRYQIGTRVTTPWTSPATEEWPHLKLDFLTQRTSSGPQITLRTSAWATVTPSDRPTVSASSLLDRVEPLQDYVTLATYAPAVTSQMRATTADGADVLLLTPLVLPAHDVESSDLRAAFDFEQLTLQTFLETRDFMVEQPQGLFAWRMLLGQVGHRAKTLEEDVSMALAAAEGIHRWCCRGPKGKPLALRLRALHATLSTEMQELLNLKTDRWADWAGWVRNHIDHGGAETYNDLDLETQIALADTVRLVTYLAVLAQFDLHASHDELRDTLHLNKGLRRLHWACHSVAELPPLRS